MNQAVTRLQTEINEVYEQIQMFLRKKGLKSEKTAVNYEKDIKDFFKLVRGKQLNELNKNDIQVTLEDFDRFILEMVDSEKYENATINRKVIAVKRLLRTLHANKLVNDISYFSEIERLPENVKGYGALSVDEVLRLAELALKEREKGKIKHYLILFALDTCIRKSALLNLKWSDFDEREDGVIVKVVDKGNSQFRQKISKEFYYELLTIKNGSEYVFPMDRKTVDRMMKRLVSQMDELKNRNIVFHSIRKAGVTFQYRLTGDLTQAKKAANHKKIETTLIYIQEQDYGITGAVSSSQNVDLDLYKKVPYEVLLAATEQMKNDYKIILNMKINEILNPK
jgi:integrase